jgi:hypothetical protein
MMGNTSFNQSISEVDDSDEPQNMEGAQNEVLKQFEEL